MTTLRAAVRPLVSSNMTTEELLREAEHTFPQPTPIIAALLDKLAEYADADHSASTTAPEPTALHCPACGALLHLED